MEQIDVKHEDLIKEAVVIGQMTKGVFGYQDILNMYPDNYDILIKEMHRINKENEKESQKSK